MELCVLPKPAQTLWNGDSSPAPSMLHTSRTRDQRTRHGRPPNQTVQQKLIQPRNKRRRPLKLQQATGKREEPRDEKAHSDTRPAPAAPLTGKGQVRFSSLESTFNLM